MRVLAPALGIIPLEDALDAALGDARTLIRDAQLGNGAVLPQVDRHLALRRRKRQCVVDQVVEHRLNHLFGTEDIEISQRARADPYSAARYHQPDTAGVIDRRAALHQLADDTAKIDRYQRLVDQISGDLVKFAR